MPKQFRTKLAGATLTLAMVAAPLASFAYVPSMPYVDPVTGETVQEVPQTQTEESTWRH